MFRTKLLANIVALLGIGLASSAVAGNWYPIAVYVHGETVWNSASTVTGTPFYVGSVDTVDAKTWGYGGVTKSSCGLTWDPLTGTLVGTGAANSSVVLFFRVVYEIGWQGDDPMPETAGGMASISEQQRSGFKPYGISTVTALGRGDYAMAHGQGLGLTTGAALFFTIAAPPSTSQPYNWLTGTGNIPVPFYKVYDAFGNPRMIATYSASAAQYTNVSASAGSAWGHGAGATAVTEIQGQVTLDTVDGQSL